ncbi:MAG: hypothetical protein KJ067_18595 [Vicinamibacteria bacterium]|nr:hypothetical protein [Vicinamibacteria bacterium]
MALLKVNFDHGRDHIEMFSPFVRDCIASLTADAFGSEDVQQCLRDQYELNLPESILSTLLSREARRGSLRREAGRYFRVPGKYGAPSIRDERTKVEREHAHVATTLRHFAAARGLELASDEDALALLLRFFEQFHVPLLVDDSPSQLFRFKAVVSRSEAVTVVRFLEHVFASDQEGTRHLARMLEGFVLQNALLLRDLSVATRRFNRLSVYLDTGFVLRALGLAGAAHATATRETIDLLRATGAECAVFEKTLEEIERILRLYERKLRTTEGTLSLRPTDVTRHFITNHYTPSDVATAIALLRTHLAALGISVWQFPARQASLTSNEASLTERLKRPEELDLEPRVTHDVDCVAAILTLRRGGRDTSLDTVRAVFATTSGSVVRTVREWYKETREVGVPPVVHVWTLSNAAWLKKPTAISDKKLNELVALCSAALRPTPEAWRAFIRELRRLETSGTITSSEQVSLAARELVACRLADADHDGDIDSKTIAEVVERAREEGAERTRTAVEAVRVEADTRLSTVTAALAAAEAAVTAGAEHGRQRDLRIRLLADRIGHVVSWLCTSVVSVIVALGVAFGLPSMLPAGPVLNAIGWCCLALVSLLNVLNLVHGTTVRAAFLTLERRISAAIRGQLM